MADETTNLSVVTGILEKFALVLGKTKDALLKDLEEKLGVGETMELNEEFITKLFKQIGYDLENFQSIEEISKPVKKVMDTAEKFGKFFDEMETDAPPEKLMELFPLIMDVIDCVRDIRDIEWGRISADLQSFAEFADESFFNKDFAKRLLDHILATLLDQAKAIFKADIEKAGQAITDARKELYEKTGAYFERANAILQFLQIKTVDYVEVIPISIPQTGLSETDAIIGDIPIKLKTIHWNRFENIFTNPIDYFKSCYPINSYSDAEVLMTNLIDLARAFNPNIPDFSSLKKLLQELLNKLIDFLKDQLLDATKEIREEIEALRQTVIKLLSTLETMAMQFKNHLTGTLETKLRPLFTDLNSLLAELTTQTNGIQSYVLNEVNGVDDSLRDILKDIKKLPSFDTIHLKCNTLLETTILATLKEKANEVDLLKGVDVQEWEKLIIQLKANYTKIFNQIPTDISNLISPSKWETVLEQLIVELRTEFNSQTANVPDSMEDVLKWVQNPTNPLSGFDINAYFSIVSKKFEDIAIPNPEKYYTELKKATSDAFDTIINTLGSELNKKAQEYGKEKLKEMLKAFINNLFIECWSTLQKEVIKPFLQPYIALIKAKIKAFSRNLIAEVMVGITNSFDGLEIPETYKKFAADVFPVLWDAQDNGINNFQDGLKLAFKLFKAIPPEVKAAISEKFSIPQLSLDVELPSYDLDIDNKFVSVTLYEYKKDDISFKIHICAFIGELEETSTTEGSTEENEKTTGVYIIPIITSGYDTKFSIGDLHELFLTIQASLNSAEGKNSELIDKFEKGAIGLFIAKSKAQFLTETNAIQAGIEAKFTRKKDKEKLSLIDSKYIDFSIGNYPQTIAIGYKDSDFFVSYAGEINEGKLIIKLREANEFFAWLLEQDIEFKFDTKLTWSLKEGFDFDGNAALDLHFNVNKRFKSLLLESIGIKAGSVPDKPHTLSLGLMTSFDVDTDVFSFAVQNLGLGLEVNYMKNGSLGDFDFSPQFSFPTGIGIVVNTSAVKGGGAISYNKEKEEFIGTLSLKILDKIGVSALALLALKMPDGSKGFSFVGILTVFFKPGIQLGMGFSLTGVGGALGLNRAIDTNIIQTGVREGTLSTVFFVDDLEKNLGTTINQIGQFFPIKKNQYFFGFLGQITFMEVLNIQVGLLIQLPDPVQLLIVGALKVALPTADKPLLEINVYFAGGIEFSKGLWFDASIVNSQIVSIGIEGDLALRIFWGGSSKGFLLSAGGFHPAYTPDPGLNIGNMKRLAIRLDYAIVKMSLETYFAITSNTVQFGADFKLVIGWDKFGISGYAGFDCLFQFKPFYFIVDIRAGVAVKCGSWTLMSIDLSFGLSGPAQWNAKGKAKFSFLLIPISVGFDKTWGKKQIDVERQYVEIYPLFAAEFIKLENWRIFSSGIKDELVKLSKPEENEPTILQPFDGVIFEQIAIPLSTKLERFGELLPGDCSEIRIVQLSIDGESLETTPAKGEFARSIFKNMTDKQKLSAPSYEKMDNGVKITGMNRYKTSIYKDKTLAYEAMFDTITVDDLKDKVAGEIQVSLPSVPSKIPQRVSARPRTPLERRSANGYRHYIQKSQNAVVESMRNQLEETRKLFLSDSDY